MIYHVQISRRAEKEIKFVPLYIRRKLLYWIESVEFQGLEIVRKVPGFHDEPLLGGRIGQRSIRLNKAYRAIYIVHSNNDVELVEIIEVNKHEY